MIFCGRIQLSSAAALKLWRINDKVLNSLTTCYVNERNKRIRLTKVHDCELIKIKYNYLKSVTSNEIKR